MSGDYASVDKQVLDASGDHVCDARDNATAIEIVTALNTLRFLANAWKGCAPHAPTTPSTEGQGA